MAAATGTQRGIELVKIIGRRCRRDKSTELRCVWNGPLGQWHLWEPLSALPRQALPRLTHNIPLEDLPEVEDEQGHLSEDDEAAKGDVMRVERILCYSETAGRGRILIKWRNLPMKDATWEPIENVLDEIGLVEEIETAQEIWSRATGRLPTAKLYHDPVPNSLPQQELSKKRQRDEAAQRTTTPGPEVSTQSYRHGKEKSEVSITSLAALDGVSNGQRPTKRPKSIQSLTEIGARLAALQEEENARRGDLPKGVEQQKSAAHHRQPHPVSQQQAPQRLPIAVPRLQPAKHAHPVTSTTERTVRQVTRPNLDRVLLPESVMESEPPRLTREHPRNTSREPSRQSVRELPRESPRRPHTESPRSPHFGRLPSFKSLEASQSEVHTGNGRPVASSTTAALGPRMTLVSSAVVDGRMLSGSSHPRAHSSSAMSDGRSVSASTLTETRATSNSTNARSVSDVRSNDSRSLHRRPRAESYSRRATESQPTEQAPRPHVNRAPPVRAPMPVFSSPPRFPISEATVVVRPDFTNSGGLRMPSVDSHENRAKKYVASEPLYRTETFRSAGTPTSYLAPKADSHTNKVPLAQRFVSHVPAPKSPQHTQPQRVVALVQQAQVVNDHGTIQRVVAMEAQNETGPSPLRNDISGQSTSSSAAPMSDRQSSLQPLKAPGMTAAQLIISKCALLKSLRQRCIQLQQTYIKYFPSGALCLCNAGLSDPHTLFVECFRRHKPDASRIGIKCAMCQSLAHFPCAIKPLEWEYCEAAAGKNSTLKHVSDLLTKPFCHKYVADYLCVLCRMMLSDPFFEVNAILGMKVLAPVHPRMFGKVEPVKSAKQAVTMSVRVGRQDAAVYKTGQRVLQLRAFKLRSDMLSYAKFPNHDVDITYSPGNGEDITDKLPCPPAFRVRKDNPRKFPESYVESASQHPTVRLQTCFETAFDGPYIVMAVKAYPEQLIEQMVRRIIDHNTASYDDCTRFIIEFLGPPKGSSDQAVDNDDDDDLVVVDSLAPLNSVKLTCPSTMVRIGVPARGIYCKHVQCFDLEFFVRSQRTAIQQARWRCPVCRLFCRPHELLVDSWIQKVLMETNEGDKQIVLEVTEGAVLEWSIAPPLEEKRAARAGVPQPVVTSL